MYYQSYEEYMRDVLGYPREAANSTYNNFYELEPRNMEMQDTDVEDLYPEVYRLVYPMVCKACTQYRGEITEDLVSRLTDEVYSNIEIENEVRGEEKQRQETRTTSTNKTSTSSAKSESNIKTSETRHSRQNNTLRDLIRILIIRELLRQRRHGRPQFPGRPPFPGNPRPPMPRNSQMQAYGINEHNPRLQGYYGNMF